MQINYLYLNKPVKFSTMKTYLVTLVIVVVGVIVAGMVERKILKTA